MRVLTRCLLSLQNFPCFFASKKSIEQQSYYAHRKSTLKDFRYTGFTPTSTVLEFTCTYGSLAHDSPSSSERVSLCGRVSAIRRHGKTTFVDIREQHIRLQIAMTTPSGVMQIHRGDIIGAVGRPFVTKKGELSLHVEQEADLVIVSPCLWMLPEYNSLKDNETRFRTKHLDLLINEESLRIMKLRSRIISCLRRELQGQGFMEVQTPVLSKEAGGAIAKPFETYQHDHKMDLFMRIAPELYLKKLLVGGFTKIFQIGKNFRNESIDQTHNPEFTSCELYCAHSDYIQMLAFTKHLFCSIVKQALSISKAVITIDGTLIDFEADWIILDFIPALESQLKTKLPCEFSSPESLEVLDELCRRHQVDCEKPRNHSRLLDKLAGAFLENQSKQPLVLMNHPRCMSPLAKPHPQNSETTERFQLFVNGWQVVNAYTELNDPEAQRVNTPNQTDFIEALEYGLVPCGGWGMGIDRFVMLLANVNRIQEVIAFPLLKEVDEQ